MKPAYPGRGSSQRAFRPQAFSRPWVTLTCLLGGIAAAVAQQTSESSEPAPTTPSPSSLPPDSLTTNRSASPVPSGVTSLPTTTYVPATIPSVPWLPPDAPVRPDWAVDETLTSPFLSPGLGTASIGANSLPQVPNPGRNSRALAPLHLGPVDFQPSLNYQFLYGTGLLSGPGREEASIQNTVSPRLVFLFGDHWTVSYTPSLRFYGSEDYEDTVNHSITLGGWAAYQNWQFRLNHATAITSDPLIETAQQTDQTVHSTGIGATWDRGDRGALDLSINQTLRFREEVVLTGVNSRGDSSSWVQQTWYDMPVRDRIKFGVGASFGYDFIDPGVDMTHERASVRISGDLGDRWSYRLSGGAQFRQFMGSDASTSISPVVSALTSYQVLENTSVSVGFNHEVGTSYFSDQFTETTSFQGNLIQVLSDRWSASANGGYRLTSYESAAVSNLQVREDSTVFAGAAVNGRILPGLTLSLSYSFRSNDSGQSDFTFDSHQVGFSLNWTL